jgi:endonuclease YncB( thermonuclease family)
LEQTVRRRLALTFLVAFAVFPAAAHGARGACVAGKVGPACKVWQGTVTTVDDGDTLDVDVARDGTRRARRIRIAGIQAMEQTAYASHRRAGDCHAVEATLRLEELVRASGGRVRLAAQHAGSVSRGRLLRTVAVRRGGRWRDAGTTIVSEGLALWLPSRAEWAPNRDYSGRTQAAATAQRGLFDPDACGAGPSAGAPLALRVNWDADGDDTANAAGEWVKVQNRDPANAIPVGGWHVRDSGLRRFTFPADAAIPPGGTVTIRVGSGVDGFSWGLRRPAFENASDDERAMGDGAYLFDMLGNVRAAMVYPCRATCTDAAQGAVALSVEPRRRRESIALTNVTAAPLDLDGYVLKSPPYSYPLESGAILPPGGVLRIEVSGAPEDDTPLERHWGFARPILGNGGDVVRLSTYTDIAIACTAWGDKSC